MILETAVLVELLIKIGTDIGTNIENRIIDATINSVIKQQEPLLTVQAEIRADQRRQIEAHYKNGTDLLGSARRTGKNKQRITLIEDAIRAFISAKNTERGEAAARAALLVGACFHLLYCIDQKYGTDNENFWYEQAFQLANQSRGPDGKPPFELIEELLKLPYLKNKDELARYWIQHPGEQKVQGKPNGYTKTQMLEYIANRIVLPNTLVNINGTGWLPANQVVAFRQAFRQAFTTTVFQQFLKAKLISAPKSIGTQPPLLRPRVMSRCLKCGKMYDWVAGYSFAQISPAYVVLWCPECNSKR